MVKNGKIYQFATRFYSVFYNATPLDVLEKEAGKGAVIERYRYSNKKRIENFYVIYYFS